TDCDVLKQNMRILYGEHGSLEFRKRKTSPGQKASPDFVIMNGREEGIQAYFILPKIILAH
ncbi:MAG TPA: hypothetical protein VLH15_07385, partial [Dehalococcoidales bacterium]|nr:hypothetical protein [Dehalococcoidales bacterium]